MAKYQVPDKYDKIQCPYDNTHLEDAYRFQRHLVRCRRNHPTKEMAHCPFNHSHVIPKPELRYHQSICSDKARLDDDLILARNLEDYGSHGNLQRPNNNWKPPPSTENWDDDEDDSAFNPAISFKSTGDRFTVFNQFKRLSTRENIDEPDSGELKKPQQLPRALLMQQQQQQQLTKATSKPTQVFSNSLARAGIGRGSPLKSVQPISQINNDRNEEDRANRLLEQLARGRGLGRGLAVVQPLVGKMATAQVTPGMGRGLSNGFGHTPGSSPPAAALPTQPDNAKSPPPTLQRDSIAQPQLTTSLTYPGITSSAATSLPVKSHSTTSPAQVTPILNPDAALFTPSNVPPVIGRGRGLLSIYVPPVGAQAGLAKVNGVGRTDSPSYVFTMNTGNGINGGTEPSFVVPSMGDYVSSSSEENSQTGNEMKDDDIKREIRKCNKKLREIECIERKAAGGKPLLADEINKLAKKQSYMSQLEQMQTMLPN